MWIDNHLFVSLSAGEMTFKEFVSEFNQEDEDVSSENEDSEMDEEWKPPGKKSKTARCCYLTIYYSS